jgi:hypothetical protein
VSPFLKHTALSLAALALAGAAVAAFPLEAIPRASAAQGVGLSAVGGLLALIIKRRAAASPSSTAGIQALALAFMARVVLLAAGLFAVTWREHSALPFIAGFFGLYFAQQAIEVSYLLAEEKHKRASQPQLVVSR